MELHSETQVLSQIGNIIIK